MKPALRQRARYRIRKKIRGTAARPRLAVFRSGKHIYAQAIDDDQGRTLASAGTRDTDLRGKAKVGSTVDAAKLVGGRIAEKLKEAGVEQVVFDRGGFLFHGRIKALADAARAGLSVTDEAQAMERMGTHPMVVEASGHNIKITRRSDLELAAFFLRQGAVA